jgi:hypothetical protein
MDGMFTEVNPVRNTCSNGADPEVYALHNYGAGKIENVCTVLDLARAK